MYFEKNSIKIDNNVLINFKKKLEWFRRDSNS